jgi:hypothetical protein
MPLAYAIDRGESTVTITGDYAEPDEWRVLLTAVSRDPHYTRGFSFIRDLRTSEHPVSAQTVVGIIGVVREFWEQLGVHRAAILTRPGIDFPAVIAQALADDQEMPLRVFTAIDDAKRWVRER